MISRPPEHAVQCEPYTPPAAGRSQQRSHKEAGRDDGKAGGFRRLESFGGGKKDEVIAGAYSIAIAT